MGASVFDDVVGVTSAGVVGVKDPEDQALRSVCFDFGVDVKVVLASDADEQIALDLRERAKGMLSTTCAQTSDAPKEA